ncbi:sphingomyelin phosphodiesterase [Rhodofomes roseus]|uniref:Sphingomyelin phosphodiesterase n=1 Tax=Rhodofomes roseus TaxID=34475 RepID=A0ABQ8KJT9_9APHY|nr:sphingomyelin phosphodiesterase [Rhodofomes roseus]KAH9838385.1 sphingomyelin phosphodiesterase [Rhodofomes roseus]
MPHMRSLVLPLWITVAAAQGNALGFSVFTAPGAFPTSLYRSYYNDPTVTTAQPQPIISDPVTHQVYPYWLTNPETIPKNDTWEPHELPPTASPSQIADAALQQILEVITNPIFGTNTCSRCQAALSIAKIVALAAPSEGPGLAVRLCEALEASADCGSEYGQYSLGATITQVAAFADVGGYDGQAICAYYAGLCPVPATSPLNLTSWFAKPKPNSLPATRQATGERMKVLHLSDLHIDPRYMVGSEANCTTGLCCRAGGMAASNTSSIPAPWFGSYLCDSPLSLVAATLQSIPVLTGTQDSPFNWTIYTGDLLSHDAFNELSREYTLYTETVVYDLMKRMLNTGPVYAVLGNHDTYMTAMSSPYNIGGGFEGQFNWDYEHLAALWELEGWIGPESAQQARTNYAAYSVQRQDGLRIVTLNTEFWYTQNAYNYINLSSSDNSGMLRFLTDELQAAEDAGDRAWILGHVPSGYDTADPISNPTNLFYQIVDRYSPHVIAGVFFGHTHKDQLHLFYANNGTVMNAETALAVAWLGPSVTPLTDYNAGFRVYEVDSGTFEVLDSYTWYADVNSFPGLDGQAAYGPEFQFEYSARDIYGSAVPDWGPNDPLNATWWHRVTEAMESDSALVETYTKLMTKSSVKTPPCTGSCINQTICAIRSGSASILIENCS